MLGAENPAKRRRRKQIMSRTSKQHVKQAKRRRQKTEKQRKHRARTFAFLDGADSYADQYERLKHEMLTRSLVGIYELDDDSFNLSLTDKLESLELNDLAIVEYESEFDSSTNESGVKGTGVTCIVQDTSGNVRPIVFLRERVSLSPASDEGDAEHAKEISFAIRVLILLHEVGHAEDISRGINFDHVQRRMDRINAEVYAHSFVCKHTRRRNYRLALDYYLDDLEEKRQANTEYVRLAAEAFFVSTDVRSLRQWTEEACSFDKKGAQYQLATYRLERKLGL